MTGCVHATLKGNTFLQLNDDFAIKPTQERAHIGCPREKNMPPMEIKSDSFWQAGQL
jgi:hypothetical protein